MGKERIEESSNQSSNSLFVSLYLVLLAFFILLNAISSVQQSLVDQALQSLKETFDEGIDESFISIHTLAPPLPSDENEDYTKMMANFVSRELELMHAKVSQEGDQVKFAIPIEAIYHMGAVQMREVIEPFFKRLVDEMKRVENQMPLEVSIIFGSDKELGTENPQDALLIARIGAMARQLESAGLDPKLMYIGMSPFVDSTQAVVSLSYNYTIK